MNDEQDKNPGPAPSARDERWQNQPGRSQRKREFDALVSALLHASHKEANELTPTESVPLKEEEEQPRPEERKAQEQQKESMPSREEKKTPLARPVAFFYQPFYPQAAQMFFRARPVARIMCRPAAETQPIAQGKPSVDVRGRGLDVVGDAGNINAMSKGRSSAYMRRNVYKSIIRHMFSYIRKNRDAIVKVLLGNGYDMAKIEHAFFKINYFNDLERDKGNPKCSQAILKKFLSKPSIYTYVLRETLTTMVNGWDCGRIGKISAENLAVYREVCTAFRASAAHLLSPIRPLVLNPDSAF